MIHPRRGRGNRGVRVPGPRTRIARGRETVLVLRRARCGRHGPPVARCRAERVRESTVVACSVPERRRARCGGHASPAPRLRSARARRRSVGAGWPPGAAVRGAVVTRRRPRASALRV